MDKKILYSVSAGVGGGLIGIFAGKLDTVLGAVLFSVGVCVLCLSVYFSAKK